MGQIYNFDIINHKSIKMKKLIFLFISTSLIFVSCSSDDDTESTNDIDPIIGQWSVSFTDTEEDEGEIFEYSFAGTFIFYPDGRGIQEGTFTFEGENFEDSDDLIWRNASSNPNYDSTSQNYLFGEEEDEVSATFSSDFNTVTFFDDEGSTVEGTRVN